MSKTNIAAGTGGERYVPYSERTGAESTVYFTRDLSPEGLKKIYEKVKGALTGKVAVKLHTGEPHGPNIIPHEWVEELMKAEPALQNAAIVETNTFYEGDRYTTEQHLKTLKINGWTFCPVDIMDAEGTVLLPIRGGKWMQQMSHGSHMTDYDSMLVLTHFKGHTMGGFGGSNKNIGIGCADGRIGKKWIHAREGEGMWSIDTEELMERITESTKATADFFGEHITYINVMRNMSVSCDCEGVDAEPVVTPNVGILASDDILAVDQACVDLIYAMREDENHALVERIETRHGHRQLSYMKEMGMGNVPPDRPRQQRNRNHTKASGGKPEAVRHIRKERSMLETALTRRSASVQTKITLKTLISAGLIALAVVLPQVVHIALGQPGGVQLLPMYLPVLIGGCLLGSRWAPAVGVLSPVVSYLITSLAGSPMPALPRLPFMMAELAVFALVSGLFSKKIAQNGLWAFPAVIAAQLAGRAVFLGLVAVCQSFAPFTVPMIRSQILAGWPGLAIQAVAVPLLVIALRALLIKEK